MNVNAISATNVSKVGLVNQCDPTKCQKTNLLAQDTQKDSVSFSGKSDSMSDEDKKELILKARTKAAGYAFWGGFISTLYYGLRSDEKVARKYNLDPVDDKKLVKKIKKEQFLWTIPAAVPGLHWIVGAGAYLYNKCVAEPNDINI